METEKWKIELMLLKEHSKKQSQFICAYILESPERMNVFIDLFLTGKYVVAQRAASVIYAITDKDPELLAPYLEKMVESLNLDKEGRHDATKRCVLRTLAFIEIPESLHAAVVNKCFYHLGSDIAAIGLKVFSMLTLSKLIPIYPDLKEEFRQIITETPYQSPAYKSCVRDILLRL